MALDAHLSRQLGFNLNRNADISIFLKKEGNEANTFIEVIKLGGKLYHRNHFWYVFSKNNLVSNYWVVKRFF